MKKLLKKYSLGAALLAALCLLPTSCIKEDLAPTDKATVTLTFTTKATTDGESNLLPAEQMKHLRIIMVNEATREVLYNVTREIADDVTSYVIKFGDVAVDQANGTGFDFYAVANEGSLTLPDAAKAALQTAQGNKLEVSALQNVELTATTGFVNPPTEARPLPQTAVANKLVEANKQNELTMELKFVCAKVQVTFYNQIEEEQNINNNLLVELD